MLHFESKPVQENTPRCITKERSVCGEGPLWDWRTQHLWWVDIAGEYIHSLDVATGLARRISTPCLVSAVALAQQGLLVATSHGIAVLNEEDSSLKPLHDPEPAINTNRLNDISVDKTGCLWAGTMSEGAWAATGALYRYDENGVHKTIDSLTITNGMDWSPDGRFFYLVDSAPRQIFRFDIDTEGQLSNRRLLKEFTKHQGRPDGLCVDSDGTLWIAMCGGGAIIGLTADGKTIEHIQLPAPQVTSCAFGGTDLTTLFITTGTFGLAAEEIERSPLSGGLFSIQMNTPGLRQNLAHWPPVV